MHANHQLRQLYVSHQASAVQNHAIKVIMQSVIVIINIRLLRCN